MIIITKKLSILGESSKRNIQPGLLNLSSDGPESLDLITHLNGKTLRVRGFNQSIDSLQGPENQSVGKIRVSKDQERARKIHLGLSSSLELYSGRSSCLELKMYLDGKSFFGEKREGFCSLERESVDFLCDHCCWWLFSSLCFLPLAHQKCRRLYWVPYNCVPVSNGLITPMTLIKKLPD